MSKKSRRPEVDAVRPATWLLLAGLVVLGVIAYCNSFGAPLVFDDLLSIQKNPGVRFGEFGRDPFAGRWLLYVTYTLNYMWTGQDVWSYHLVNLVLHLLDGILIFFVALRIFERAIGVGRRQRIWAFLAAGFFLVHPVQTEAVTYISQRSEMLSAIFFIAAFWIFVRWPENKIGILLSLIIAIPFLLALSSKETAISLPAMMFLYDFIFISDGSIRAMASRWTFYATYLLGGVAVGYYLVTVTLRQSVGPTLQGHLSSSHYFYTELRVMTRYVYLIFLPIGQRLDYNYRPSASFLEPSVVLSFLFISAILVFAWRIRSKHKVFSFSIFWFFLALAPTSSFLPIQDVIFEHRLYLPLVGVCLAFPILMDLISTQAQSRYRLAISAGAASVVALSLLTAGALIRNYVWGDEVRLWEEGVEKTPQSGRAYDGLMWAYFKQGKYDEAIKTMNKAIQVIPESARDLRETLANLFLKTGKYDDAIAIFKESAEYAGSNKDRAAMEWNNVGAAYLYKWNQLQAERSRTEMSEQTFAERRDQILIPASEAFLKASETDLGATAYLDSYINTLFYMQNTDPVVSKSLANPNIRESYRDLYIVGKYAFLKGMQAVDEKRDGTDFLLKAVEFFEAAEKLNKTERLLYFNHAFALNALGKQDDAIAKYLQAIRIDPIFSEAHLNLGLIYMYRKDYPKAVDHISEILRFDPNNRSANLNLGRINCAQGDRTAAKEHLQMVLGANVNDSDALQVWQQCGLSQ